eukprot:Polyplicarium_translucidae@DN2532_c0_g2_i1.p2
MNLTEEEAEAFPCDRAMKKVIKDVFAKLDARLATAIPACKDGSTAVVVFVLACGGVYCATLGDALAVLCQRRGEAPHAIPLGEAHKPWAVREKERILAKGGTIDNGRVNGILEVTRSVGDFSFKKFGVLCHPTITKVAVDVTKASGVRHRRIPRRTSSF